MVREIHAKVKALKQSRELEERYMQFEEMLRKEHKEGRKEGQKVGEQRMLELISQMLADGKADQIERLQSETEFYEEMLKKYHL